jgi:small neutral amino acid transporter SnatA (MarC family)
MKKGFPFWEPFSILGWLMGENPKSSQAIDFKKFFQSLQTENNRKSATPAATPSATPVLYHDGAFSSAASTFNGRGPLSRRKTFP